MCPPVRTSAHSHVRSNACACMCVLTRAFVCSQMSMYVHQCVQHKARAHLGSRGSAVTNKAGFTLPADQGVQPSDQRQCVSAVFLRGEVTVVYKPLWLSGLGSSGSTSQAPPDGWGHRLALCAPRVL